MKYEKAIDIFERMLSHYQGELYTDSEKEIKEALELGKQALKTGEIYMSAVDYNLFLEGYKQGKKDFGRPQGKWIVTVDKYNIQTCKCSICGRIEVISHYDFDKIPFCHCGADMRVKKND